MPSPADIAPLLTADQVAEILGVSRAYVYQKRLEIGFVRLGRVIRFSRDAVEHFIAENTESVANRIGKLQIT